MIPAAFPEIAIVPDVCADADAEAAAVQVERLRTVERLEVPIFIEDVIRGKKGLPESLCGNAVMQQYGAVEQRPSFVRGVRLRHADQHRRQTRSLLCERGQPPPAFLPAPATQQ